MENEKEKQEEKDDIELAKDVSQKLDSEENSQVSAIQHDELRNISLTQTDIHMFGDGVILMQIVQLMSYIRHAVKNNMKTEIKLTFGNEIANAEFNFDANGFQVPDLFPQNEVQIN